MLTISDKSMNLYDLNKKVKSSRQKGFLFDQLNKLTIKLYSSLPNVNICYYLYFQIPIPNE